MSIDLEALVVRSAREYLLMSLPAKVASINAERVAVLKAAYAGPYTIPSGGTLLISAVSRTATPVTVSLSAGSTSAADLATAINATPVPGLTASADSDGRLVLTSTTAPVDGTPSCVALGADTTGTNALFGWDAGGEHAATSALIAPLWRGICDGWPVTVPDMGRTFWVLFGDRTSRPLPNEHRRDEHEVSIETVVMLPVANASPHRSREAISACVRAVRELLLTTTGRYLGRAGQGDVVFSTMSKTIIPGKPFAFTDPSGKSVLPGVLFDFAQFTLTCRVFQRPAS